MYLGFPIAVNVIETLGPSSFLIFMFVSFLFACLHVDLNLIQDEREIKRQRRKQSNRESARRSRLRKQVNLRFC